jgi:hypothetical protein
VNLCLGLPLVFSPVIGWLVDAVGFAPVFQVTIGLIVFSGLTTFRLEEPRHRLYEGQVGTIGTGGEE